MSDGDALLKAILAHPAEDTPRLVYADWLDENGQPERAHVVRDMVRRPHLYDTAARDRDGFSFPTAAPDEPRIRVCQWLAMPGGADAELVRTVGGYCRGVDGAYVWWRQAGESIEAPPLYVLWRRGFVEEVRCTAADWVAHGDAILGAHPVEKVTLTTWPKVDSVVYGNHVRGYRFAGREYVHAATSTVGMLETEWPGVAFALPADPGAPAPVDWSLFTDPDPPLVSWWDPGPVYGTVSDSAT